MKSSIDMRQILQHRHFELLILRLSASIVTVLLSLTFFPMASASESDPDEVLDCLIEPWVVSDVGSAVQGVIDKVFVDRGERVEKGQPLAQLESGVEHTDVTLAEVRAETESEVLAREAELKLAKLELARLEDLHSQQMITPQQRDESTARYQIASAALAQALKNRKIQQLELERTERQYARRILTSPVDGVVVAQQVFAGEFVYDNPVMTIASLDPLRVEVVLPARLFGTIAVGDVARLIPELGGDSVVKSMVDIVDPVLDSRSGTFGVRLKLANPDNKIPAGQRCGIVFGPSPAAARSDDAERDEEAATADSSGQ